MVYVGNNVNNTSGAISRLKNKHLNKETIAMFWNVLKQDKSMSSMYFNVGKPYINSTKHYILVRFERETFKWYPSSIQPSQWDNEYEKLKQAVCNHFNFNNDDNSMVMHLVVERGDDNDEDSKDETMYSHYHRK